MKPASQAQPGATAREQKIALGGDSPPPAAISSVGGDASDLAAARAGDDGAFARLYDRHAPVVLSFCRRHSLAEAQDATQETFIRAQRKLHKVESPEKLRSWLFAIARRVCSERSRSARRRARHEEQFALSQAGPSSGRTTTADPSERSERGEELRRLSAAMDRLDDRERLAVHLYYLEADPVHAASSALGLSRSGYYKLLGRARERLAELMSEVDLT